MNRSSGDPGRNESGDDLFEDADLGEGGDDPDAPILGEFVNRWENAGDERARDGIVDDFCGDHPHLRDVIHELVAARRGIGRLISVDAQKAPDPERLGPYRILRLLACGGMGRVYEAKDGVLPRKLAVKTIQVDRGSIPRLLDRFQSERRALARLHHTNIIPLYNAGEEDGLLYFAMPLIRGPNLDDLVAASAMAGTTTWDELIGQATIVSSRRRSIGRLTDGRGGRSATTALLPPVATAPVGGPARPPVTTAYVRHVAEIVAVAAEALHSAHEVGVLHFDVKPSNILIEPLEPPKPAAGDGTPPRTFWGGVRGGLAWVGRRLRDRNPSRQQRDRSRIRVHP